MTFIKIRMDDTLALWNCPISANEATILTQVVDLKQRKLILLGELTDRTK